VSAVTTGPGGRKIFTPGSHAEPGNQKNQILKRKNNLMARYEHLPIFKKAYDLNLYFEKTVKDFSRYHKYTLGSELRNGARNTVELIIKANNTWEKKPILEQVRDQLERLKLVLHLCKDVQAFNNFNSFQVAINLVIDIIWQSNMRSGAHSMKSNTQMDCRGVCSRSFPAPGFEGARTF
jgi:hypothetical protein